MTQMRGLQTRWLELATALFFIAIGAVVITDSLLTGMHWASDGPQPGYFPFYIGLAMILTAAWVGLSTILAWKRSQGEFASGEQLSLVLKMFVPCCLFVVAVFFLGIYVAGALYISAFMMWQGKFSWLRAAIVSLCVMAVLFGMFELWFKVPLPKGPVEALWGL